MNDSKNTGIQSDDEENMDKLISDLYQQSKQDESVTIPPALDDVILTQAKASIHEVPEDEEAGQPKVVALKRKRWEVPASVAATLVICTSLFLLNQNDITPDFDSALPPQIEDQPALMESEFSEALSSPAPEASVSPAKQPVDELQTHKPAAASARMQSGIAEERSTATEAIPATGAAAHKSFEAESSAQQRDFAWPRPTEIESDAHALERKMGKSQVAETTAEDAQLIDPQYWLEQISATWNSGDKESAASQLAEFRTQFPDYDLKSFCISYSDICKNN